METTDFFKNIAGKLDPVYRKIKAGYFAIFMVIVGIITLIISSLLYSSVESFTYFTHWISNLGARFTISGLPPNGSNIVFAIGLWIGCILGFLFVVDIVNKMDESEKKMPWLINSAAIAEIISIIGAIGLTIFDMYSLLALIHVVYAFLFFFGTILMILFFSLEMLFNSSFAWQQSIIGLMVSILGLIFMFSLFPFFRLGTNPLAILNATGSEYNLPRFLEWIYLYAVFFWYLETGFYSLKHF